MKQQSSKTSRLFQRIRPHLLVGGGFLAVITLYLTRLGSVPNKLSSEEWSAYQNNNHLQNILDNPLNAPHKLLDFLWIHLLPHSIFAARLTSALFAILAVVLFFVILNRWHGRRTALLGTILFAPSGWLLHVGRLGTAQIMWLLIPLVLILLGSWLHAVLRHSLAVIISVLVLGLLLFVPGGVWFVGAFAVLLRGKLIEHWKGAGVGAHIWGPIIMLGYVGLLGVTFYRQPHLIQAWLGAPEQWPSVMVAVRHLFASATYLFARGPYAPQVWLAHIPILDVFTGVVCLLGTYFYAKHFRNLRTRTLVVFAVLGGVFVALNGAAAMSFIVPLAYLVAATGVTYLLHEWLCVFPRNPLARGIGIGLVTTAIVCAVAYNTGAYFIAWHHSPDTAHTFHQSLIQ